MKFFTSNIANFSFTFITIFHSKTSQPARLYDLTICLFDDDDDDNDGEDNLDVVLRCMCV